MLETVTRLVASGSHGARRREIGVGSAARDEESVDHFLGSDQSIRSGRGRAVEGQVSSRHWRAFNKAVELDPKFGLGYQGMAVMSRNLGRLQDAEKYAKESLRYLDGMTERERFAARGYYYSRIGDYQQCVKEYGDLVARYPADYVAHNQRAICMSQLRDIRGTVAEMRQIVRILPNHVVYRSNLALALTFAGEFDAASKRSGRCKSPIPVL